MILLFSAQFSSQHWSTQAHHPTVNSSDKTHQRCVSLLTHTDPQPLTNVFICREVLEAAGGDGQLADECDGENDKTVIMSQLTFTTKELRWRESSFSCIS